MKFFRGKKKDTGSAGGMGCGSSQPSGAAATSSPSAPSAKGGVSAPSASADRLGIFSCHLHVAPPSAPSSSTGTSAIISSNTGNSQLQLKETSGKSTTYEADCILANTGNSGGDVASYYSENISPVVKACCNYDIDKNSTFNALLFTVGGHASGKTTTLYGQDDRSSSGGIVQFICKQLLDTCTSDSERTLVTLSLIGVPTGKTESGAYDCLANVPSSSAAANDGAKPPLLATAADAKNPFEVEIQSMDDATKVLKRGRYVLATTNTSTHSLLVATIRSLDGSGNVVRSNQIKFLDLHGDVPSRTASNNADGKSGAKGGRGGGRGGRKGGRGWSSYDTRNGAATNDEDQTIRTLRRVVDFLSRRFKNVPYQDSILTTLVQSELEGRYTSKQAKSVVCLVCIEGQPDSSDGKKTSKWREKTVYVLDFMDKMRKITVLPPDVSSAEVELSSADRVREIKDRSRDWLVDA